MGRATGKVQQVKLARTMSKSSHHWQWKQCVLRDVGEIIREREALRRILSLTEDAQRDN